MNARPEILEVLPFEVKPHDVLGEGRIVRSVSILGHASIEFVDLEVCSVRVVNVGGFGSPLLHPEWSATEILTFTSADLKAPMRVVRGMPMTSMSDSFRAVGEEAST
jgi:hypothetical protein